MHSGCKYKDFVLVTRSYGLWYLLVMDNLKCAVCSSHAKKPKLCPSCKKLICEECLDRSFVSNPECPHCKVVTTIEAFLSLPWLDELITSIPKTDFCKKHSIKRISLYCTCGDLLCPDCWDEHMHKGTRKKAKHSLHLIETEHKRCWDEIGKMKIEK